MDVLDSPPQIPLRLEELSVSRADVSTVTKDLEDPETFHTRLAQIANITARAAELDDERLPLRRKADLNLVEKLVRAQHPGALHQLSGIDATVLDLAPDAPEELILARIDGLRKKRARGAARPS